jgi:hypothetical protein
MKYPYHWLILYPLFRIFVSFLLPATNYQYSSSLYIKVAVCGLILLYNIIIIYTLDVMRVRRFRERLTTLFAHVKLTNTLVSTYIVG